MKKTAQHIAHTLKKLRQERSWSLDKTAEETGVSKAMLGQIEREESSPTIATLWKIASGFHTSFSSFLEDQSLSKRKTLYRSQIPQNMHEKNKKMRVTSLFPFDKQLNCEIFMIELLPTCEHLSDAHEPGVIEHIIIIEGSMEILLKKKWKTLHTGDGLRFSADQSHGYRNLTSKPMRFYNIIHYPISAT